MGEGRAEEGPGSQYLVLDRTALSYWETGMEGPWAQTHAEVRLRPTSRLLWAQVTRTKAVRRTQDQGERAGVSALLLIHLPPSVALAFLIGRAYAVGED